MSNVKSKYNLVLYLSVYPWKQAQVYLTNDQLNLILEEPNCTGETLFAVASYTSLNVSLDIGTLLNKVLFIFFFRQRLE